MKDIDFSEYMKSNGVDPVDASPDPVKFRRVLLNLRWVRLYGREPLPGTDASRLCACGEADLKCKMWHAPRKPKGEEKE